MSALYISKEQLKKEGFFSSLASDVDHQGAVCGCESDEDTFICELCRREVPNCFGAGDEFDELCDDCAVRQMARHESLIAI